MINMRKELVNLQGLDKMLEIGDLTATNDAAKIIKQIEVTHTTNLL